MGKQRKPAAQGMAELRGPLERLGFEILPAGDRRYFVRKYGCAAGLAEDESGELVLFAPPGRVIGGELARLVNRGFQQFLKTADAEIPARMEDLKALHDFDRDLYFAAGQPMLFNQALGSTSDRHLYDRIWYRDQGAQPQAWAEPPTRLPEDQMAAAVQFNVSPGASGH